jgi:hypothetical protein
VGSGSISNFGEEKWTLELEYLIDTYMEWFRAWLVLFSFVDDERVREFDLESFGFFEFARKRLE